jgi:DNA-binding transcriptional LysR family regulator
VVGVVHADAPGRRTHRSAGEPALRLTQSGSRAGTPQQISSGTADVAFYRIPLDAGLATVAVMNEKLHLVAGRAIPFSTCHGPIGRPPLAYYSFATYPASMRSRQLVERWAPKAGALSAAVREFVELLIRITLGRGGRGHSRDPLGHRLQGP